VDTNPKNGPNDTDPSDVMRLGEIAKTLDISNTTAKRLLSSGSIPGFRLGGVWRCDRVTFRNWLASKSAS
jgi:excisionase family DNA binding protein